MKRYLAALLALCLLSLAGCAKRAPEPAAAPAAPSAAADTPAPAAPKPEPEPEPEPSDGAEVYTFDGLEVSIPAEVAEQLLVETGLEPWNEHWTPLISLSEKASVEAGERDHPGQNYGDGALCTISQLDRIGFESWVSGDEDPGASLFARRGDDVYYLISRPTDVRFYRSGTAQPEEVARWQQLTEWTDALPDDIVARNGLTAYDAHELFEEDYTYGGEHVDLGCRFPDEPMDLVMLSLSQPAKRGTGGVWCVERVRYVYSAYNFTDTHLVFPAGFGIETTAADYYAQLQRECDAGERPELLTPVGAALDYARRMTWLFGEDVSATDFEVIDALG